MSGERREFGRDKGRRREERRLGGEEAFVQGDQARKRGLTEGLERRRALWQRAQNGVQNGLEKETISRKDQNGVENRFGPNGFLSFLK